MPYKSPEFLCYQNQYRFSFHFTSRYYLLYSFIRITKEQFFCLLQILFNIFNGNSNMPTSVIEMKVKIIPAIELRYHLKHCPPDIIKPLSLIFSEAFLSCLRNHILLIFTEKLLCFFLSAYFSIWFRSFRNAKKLLSLLKSRNLKLLDLGYSGTFYFQCYPMATYIHTAMDTCIKLPSHSIFGIAVRLSMFSPA